MRMSSMLPSPKTLEDLRLSSTSVTGSIASLGGLANLQRLYLDSTSVTGDIASLGGLTNLIQLPIQGSYIYGDTAAVTVSQTCGMANCFSFTPCADLGGCGAGSLVANPSTYAGRTEAVCCGTAT